MIHQSLALSQAETRCAGEPAGAALLVRRGPGSILIARFGAFRVLVGGILLTGLGSALRGAAPDAAMLFAATFVMGMRHRDHAALAAARRARVGAAQDRARTPVYSNGLLMGRGARRVAHDSRRAAARRRRLATGARWAWSVPIFLVALAGMLGDHGIAAKASKAAGALDRRGPRGRARLVGGEVLERG